MFPGVQASLILTEACRTLERASLAPSACNSLIFLEFFSVCVTGRATHVKCPDEHQVLLTGTASSSNLEGLLGGPRDFTDVAPEKET